MHKKSATVTVVIPVYNEAAGIATFHKDLTEVLRQATDNSYEIVYCDDGSADTTQGIITHLCDDKHVKLVALSRNFGKEYAITAALAHASGDAVIMMDADGQHPVEAIPEFIEAWRNGADVVIGQRSAADAESFNKRLSSKLFYSLLNRFSSLKVDPLATDFRLLDRVVVDQYLLLSETDRQARGLIDWLGFTRTTVAIERKERIAGSATYSTKKLIKLAVDSLVSQSSRPLYLLLALGAVIMLLAGILGAAVLIEQIALGDPLHWKFTGTAMLGILTLFLVGIVISAQGIASLYIATIYNQVKGRPLYIVNYKKSVGILNTDAELR
jgi:dolichol-phosphate mannosyltransferase